MLLSIINILNRVFSPKSIIIIITTNYKYKLEPTLIKLGYIDYTIKFIAIIKY